MLRLDGFRGSIQWEQSPDRKTWSDVPSGNKGTVRLTPRQTTYYRARVTEPGCSPVYSDIKAAYSYGGAIIGAKVVKGKATLPEGSTVKLAECSILSFFEKSRLSADGSFEVLMADSTAEDLLILTKPDQEVLMLGTFYGTDPAYELSAESTALALLMMYPWLKPIPTAEKGALLELYKSDPDFARLKQQVEAVVKAGGNLYDASNTELARSILTLVGKSYNDSRLRLSKPTDSSPVDIIDGPGSSVRLVNNTSFSYVVGVYQKKGNEEVLVKNLLVAGSSLATSPWKSLITDQVASTEVAYDFSAADQGDYVIKFRSGLAGDGSPENEKAFDVNVSDLAFSLFDNVLTNFFSFANLSPQVKGCLDATLTGMVGLFKTSIKEQLQTGASASPNQLASILQPRLATLSDHLGSCAIDHAAKEFLVNAFKSVSLLSKVIEAAPTFRFMAEWPLRSASVDGCKFVYDGDNGKRLVNCFTIQKNNGSLDYVNREKNYTCEELPVKVRLREDTKYYPFRLIGQPIEGINVYWEVKEGAGSFLTGNPWLKGNYTTTDGNGETQITWKLSEKKDEKQQAAAQIMGGNASRFFVLQRANYVTTTHVPKPVVEAIGENQRGFAGQVLPKPIGIFVKDATDGSPMLMDRFVIEYEIEGGGKIIADPATSTPVNTTWKWQLGPGMGEQRITFTLKSKNCNWQFERNTIVIKANKPSAPINGKLIFYVEIFPTEGEATAVSIDVTIKNSSHSQTFSRTLISPRPWTTVYDTLYFDVSLPAPTGINSSFVGCDGYQGEIKSNGKTTWHYIKPRAHAEVTDGSGSIGFYNFGGIGNTHICNGCKSTFTLLACPN
jgi:hypothetical protein